MTNLAAREVVEKLHQYDDLPSLPKINIHFLATASGNEHLLEFMTEKPDNPIRFEEVTVEDYDAVCVPGGAWNSDQLRANPAVLSFLQKSQATGKPLGALCHGSQVFLSAKLTKGRNSLAPLDAPPRESIEVRALVFFSPDA